MKIGEKVVCVKGWTRPEVKRANHVPIVGNVYVVAGFHDCWAGGLHLVGVQSGSKCSKCGGDATWSKDHFRPLDEMKAESQQHQTQVA